MADTLFVNATASIPGTVVVAPFLNDVNTATYDYLSSVAGTNTITAVGPLSMTAYATGQNFYFNPALANGGATTINISGLGAKTIQKANGLPLVAADLAPGAIAHIVYDGTNFKLINPQTFSVGGIVPVANGGTGVSGPGLGRLIGIQTLTTSGTYTPTTGTTSIVVEGVGGGGAGGGVPVAGGLFSVAASGGTSGTWGTKRITSGFSGVSYVIGAGGAGVSGAAGAAGTVTTFGAVLTLPGGSGGPQGGATALGVSSLPPTYAGVAVGADWSVVGGRGTVGFALSSTNCISGFGAGNYYGQGGAQGISTGISVTAGNPGVAYGSGGGGAVAAQNGATAAGGAGAAGVLIIYEYA